MQKTIVRIPGLILLVLLLAACTAPGETSPTMPSTMTPLTAPTGTNTPTASPIPTLSPVARFEELSKVWRVAYIDYDSQQVCASYADDSGKLCIPFGNLIALQMGAWSMDGSRVVLMDYKLDLFIWDLDEGITPFLIADYVKVTPDWSPDGKTIAYASSEMQRSLGQSFGLDIYVQNLDGTDHRNLTSNLAGKSNSRNPDWSPDGSKIAFFSHGTKPNPNYPTDPWPFIYDDTEIFVVTPAGGDPVKLTNNEAEDVIPVWSPDGLQIAFLSNREGSFDLYTMNADGTDIRLAGSLALERLDEDSDYYWLPDKEFILFEDKLIELATRKITRLQFGFSASSAAWLLHPLPDALIPIPTPHCAAGWTRLALGMLTTVSQGDPNRVRSGPGKNHEITGQLYSGTISKVVEGPICADGLIFWKVENTTLPGGVGWTAEGDGREYWLEPYKP